MGYIFTEQRFLRNKGKNADEGYWECLNPSGGWRKPCSEKLHHLHSSGLTTSNSRDEEAGQTGSKRKAWLPASTYLNAHQVALHPPPSQASIHRTLEEPEKDFCTALTTEVFAHTVVADPHCLASQKHQPSISAFLKYLPSFKLQVLHCFPNEVILGSLNQGRDGRTGGIHRREQKRSFVRNPERNRLRRKPGRTLKNKIETYQTNEVAGCGLVAFDPKVHQTH